VEGKGDESQVNVEWGWVVGRNRRPWRSGEEDVEALERDVPEEKGVTRDVGVGEYGG